jgi:hypothetical protein
MKTVRRYILDALAAALLAGCIGSGPANAQPGAGKFTLPFEANWNGITLAPGHYTFRFDRPLGTMSLVRGGKHVGMLLAQSANREIPGGSSLMLEETAGVITVRELRLADWGLILRYGPAKAAAGKVIESRRLVPVTAQGAAIRRGASDSAPLSGTGTAGAHPGAHVQ